MGQIYCRNRTHAVGKKLRPALSHLHDNHPCWRGAEKMSQNVGWAKRQRAHHSQSRVGWMVGTAQMRLCPPYGVRSRPLFATSRRNNASPKSLTRAQIDIAPARDPFS